VRVVKWKEHQLVPAEDKAIKDRETKKKKVVQVKPPDTQRYLAEWGWVTGEGRTKVIRTNFKNSSIKLMGGGKGGLLVNGGTKEKRGVPKTQAQLWKDKQTQRRTKQNNHILDRRKGFKLGK